MSQNGTQKFEIVVNGGVTDQQQNKMAFKVHINIQFTQCSILVWVTTSKMNRLTLNRLIKTIEGSYFFFMTKLRHVSEWNSQIVLESPNLI